GSRSRTGSGTTRTRPRSGACSGAASGWGRRSSTPATARWGWGRVPPAATASAAGWRRIIPATTASASASAASVVEDALRAVAGGCGRDGDGPVHGVLGLLFGAHGVVEVEAEERDHAIDHVRGERGDRKHDDAGDRFGDRRQ